MLANGLAAAAALAVPLLLGRLVDAVVDADGSPSSSTVVSADSNAAGSTASGVRTGNTC